MLVVFNNTSLFTSKHISMFWLFEIKVAAQNELIKAIVLIERQNISTQNT